MARQSRRTEAVLLLPPDFQQLNFSIQELKKRSEKRRAANRREQIGERRKNFLRERN
jgi:hypothetical protein